MMLIPFTISPDEYNVFVILEAENLTRMKANDPAQVNLWKMPDFDGMKLRDVIIASPSAKDIVVAETLLRAGDGPAALRHLSRGFKFKPKEGDSDLPYQVAKPQ